jgi:ABC-2 type transport system permease protein
MMRPDARTTDLGTRTVAVQKTEPPMTVSSILDLTPGRAGRLPAAIRAYAPLEIRRTLRNRRFLMFAIVFPVVFYLLYTAVGVGQGTADPAWAKMFLVSMAAYGAIGGALSAATVIAVERSTGWTRQLRVMPLPPSAYLTSKLVAAALTTIPAIILVSIAGIEVNHVSLPLASWAQLLISLVLGAIPFAALAVLIGYVADANSAQGLTALVYFSVAILGGLWTPLSALPDGLATIGRMLPSSHLANLGMAAIAGGPPDVVDVAVLAAWTAAIGALVVWRYRVTANRPGA